MQYNSGFDKAPLFDRFIASASYLTLGTVGIVWFLINTIVIKKRTTKFLMCNLIQSFMLSIIYAIITLTYNIFIDLLVRIPFIGIVFLKMHVYLFHTPVFNTFSLINYILLLLLCYLALFACFGKFPYIPYLTDISRKISG